jgi:cell division protein FtsW (lipid II flippase)
MAVPSDEYTVLRQTIRERGTVRMALVPFVFLGWAACAIAAAALITVAVSTLVPLLVLAAGFEAIFALHVNVERVGRYLQVFHEPEGAGWEHVAMRFGQTFPQAGPDALFARLFVLTVSMNFLPAVLGGTWPELALVGAAHLALLYRIRVAQRFAAGQRAADLERFAALRAAGDGSDGPGGR